MVFGFWASQVWVCLPFLLRKAVWQVLGGGTVWWVQGAHHDVCQVRLPAACSALEKNLKVQPSG